MSLILHLVISLLSELWAVFHWHSGQPHKIVGIIHIESIDDDKHTILCMVEIFFMQFLVLQLLVRVFSFIIL